MARHITVMHHGQALDGAMRDTLIAIQRCTCTDPICGGFRRVGQDKCNRCRQRTAVRTPAVGDVIAGVLTAGLGHSDMQTATQDSSELTREVHDDTSATQATDIPSIPASFSSRIRNLSCNTIVHLPLSLRLQLLRITKQCWDGIADGSDIWAMLEEGRSKLIAAPIPEGMSTTDEVSQRATLILFCNESSNSKHSSNDS